MILYYQQGCAKGIHLQWNPSRSLPSGPNQSSLPPVWNTFQFWLNTVHVYMYICTYIRINMLTFKYRNMKFSRNDLPFRKAPENLLESANSLSVSNPYIRLQNRPQKKLYLPQIWCKWVCLWYCPCWGCRWEPPRPGRTCVSRSHHQSSQFVSPSPY